MTKFWIQIGACSAYYLLGEKGKIQTVYEDQTHKVICSGPFIDPNKIHTNKSPFNFCSDIAAPWVDAKGNQLMSSGPIRSRLNKDGRSALRLKCSIEGGRVCDEERTKLAGGYWLVNCPKGYTAGYTKRRIEGNGSLMAGCYPDSILKNDSDLQNYLANAKHEQEEMDKEYDLLWSQQREPPSSVTTASLSTQQLATVRVVQSPKSSERTIIAGNEGMESIKDSLDAQDCV